MAKPDDEAKGQAQQDHSKNNAIPEVSLKLIVATINLTSPCTIWHALQQKVSCLFSL